MILLDAKHPEFYLMSWIFLYSIIFSFVLGYNGFLKIICSFWVLLFKIFDRIKRYRTGGFPGGAVVKNLPANAGDTGSSPGLGRSHMPPSN